MSKKRQNENGQLRREDYEAMMDKEQDDESGPGNFQRAASDELAKRKKFKIKRPGAASGAKASPPPPSSSPFAGFTGLSSSSPATSPPPAEVKSNPFAGFSGLVSNNQAATSSTSTAEKPNPFSGFTGLTSRSSSSSSPNTSSGLTSVAGPASSRPKPANNKDKSSYSEEIRELNTAFHSWVSRQSKENPVALWEGAMKDYLRYVDDIKRTYGVKGSADAASTAHDRGRNSQTADTPIESASSTSKISSSSPSPSKKQSPLGFSLSSSNPSPPKSAPVASFTFGAGSGLNASPQPEPAAKAPAPTPGFSFGGISGSAAGSSSVTSNTSTVPAFSFATLPSSSPPPSVTTQPNGFSGFSFNLAPKQPAAASEAAMGGEDDDENVGREEATVIIKADTGDENVDYENEKVKLLYFKMEAKEWADKGTHSFQILTHKETGDSRILMRDGNTGKVVLNALLYKALKVDEVGKNGLSMNLPDETGTKLVKYMFRTKPELRVSMRDAVRQAASTQRK